MFGLSKLWTGLLIGAALLGMLKWLHHSIEQGGYDKCQAEHAEAQAKQNEKDKANDAAIDNSIPLRGSDADLYNFLWDNARQ